MGALPVRRIAFDFENIDFIWNPRNPEFSMMMNILSFQAIGFERFICRSMDEARSGIEDQELLAEIRDFKAQEMQHSKGHLGHVRALVSRYPELDETFRRSTEDFDEQWEDMSLEDRLAYSAIIEATSLPLYRTMILHRDLLFAGGDSNLSSFFIWHFCEEIEHRSSALKVYDHVVGKKFHRLRIFPMVGGHLAANMRRIEEDFRKVVPEAKDLDLRKAMAELPRWERIKMSLSLLTSQLPWHNPGASKMPDYCEAWLADYETGKDMSRAYP